MMTPARRWFRALFAPAPGRPAARLGVQRLDDRLTPATWTVTVPEADPYALLRYVEVVQSGLLLAVTVNDVPVATRFTVPIFGEVEEVVLTGSALQDTF